MSRPSARVGRNRRRAYLLILAAGLLAIVAAFPTFNAAYLVGMLAVVTGAAGFVIETETGQGS
ncbi:hypothetical protein [Arthrobacter sp. ISL-72]|uniref:hypothetical protein n=1 Tax=Arthrobacter sp. ISL-72 TaxID=2819114 RepID=UPI001BEC33E9|nr:hypothetical protein [Arthrobacter sp. ISL-72]MBT2594756.1 hypothetical protein [Arthrobacter sp. ISL-72]